MNSLLQFLASFFIGILIVEPFSFQADSTLDQLNQFLESKSSPIPARELIQYDNWPMILAISAAESTYGQNMAGEFNAWGIKDFRLFSNDFGITRNFESWDESIEYASNLLYEYDPINGMPNPQAMVKRWKFVFPHQHWVDNVNYSLSEINQKISIKSHKPILLLPIP